MPATRTTIPDTEFRGKVRAYDSDTSWEAAGKQTRTKTRILRGHLLWILRGTVPMTDDKLIEVYGALRSANPTKYAEATPQSIRSRRNELTIAGDVVWTGQREPSSNGGPSNVWKAVEQ